MAWHTVWWVIFNSKNFKFSAAILIIQNACTWLPCSVIKISKIDTFLKLMKNLKISTKIISIAKANWKSFHVKGGKLYINIWTYYCYSGIYGSVNCLEKQFVLALVHLSLACASYYLPKSNVGREIISI